MTDKGCVKIGESPVAVVAVPAALAVPRDTAGAHSSPDLESLLQPILAWHAPTGCRQSP